jgi:hypothetical protein
VGRTSRDKGSSLVFRFVNFGQEVHHRCASCSGYEVINCLIGIPEEIEL